MNPIDTINLQTMRSASAVRQYATRDALQPRERATLDRVADEARGKPILDLGVGAGRTVKPLREVSQDYLAIDYSPEMVAACKSRFPDARCEQGDARDLKTLADGSIFLAMFSCNGLCMVGHEDRLKILREVHRVLQPGGVFLATVYNQNSDDHAAGYKLPDLELSANPARLLVRLGRFAVSTVRSRRNWQRNHQHDVRTPEYSVINDACHDYGTMLYYITLENQRKQLETCGFLPNAEAYDQRGKLITTDTRDNDFAMIARKA